MSSFLNRDISWLSFNGRLLTEAAKESLPLLERLKFLSIFSSNLDEFYRVRMPAIRALHKINKKKELEIVPNVIDTVNENIAKQQQYFGEILGRIIPALKVLDIYLVYAEALPEEVQQKASEYFFSHLLAFLRIVAVEDGNSFFPENNKLYQLVVCKDSSRAEKRFIVTIPSDSLPRFVSLDVQGRQYIVFIDDIIRFNLLKLPGFEEITGVFSFKVTRDAELDMADEYEGDLAEKIEKQIEKRDFGLATRLLYDGSLPPSQLNVLIYFLKFEKATLVEGGAYHNLKDLSALPISNSALAYPKQVPVPLRIPKDKLLLEVVKEQDILVNTPYQSYDTVVRFFSEAAVDPNVESIYITVYRLATDSRIANALITAAQNGKEVFVFVELKARFDEANNIKWSKKMKAAGIRIIYSIPSLKVHAKIALVTCKNSSHLGILSTGNFNEVTASFYTDYVLLTSNSLLLKEMEQLFLFLEKRRKPQPEDAIDFKSLIVAQFNLQQRFYDLIGREILNARQGLEASITIKLNNLEEEGMISQLYRASQAGVKVTLIVRGICRLIPGLAGLSENIIVKRIVDRYLEHGRIFVFANNGQTEVFMGSADWMYRNIHRRIEVCYPVYDAAVKKQVLNILALQIKDNAQAVFINQFGENLPVESPSAPLRSQQEIYEYLKRGEQVAAELF